MLIIPRVEDRETGTAGDSRAAKLICGHATHGQVGEFRRSARQWQQSFTTAEITGDAQSLARHLAWQKLPGAFIVFGRHAREFGFPDRPRDSSVGVKARFPQQRRGRAAIGAQAQHNAV